MQPDTPGAPSSAAPPRHEPAEPQGPLPPKPDQRPAAAQSPTGAPLADEPAVRNQQGAHLTTAQGARLRDTDHSLTAGTRGPTLLQDHHLREKITHFDHERIPERVVHARGAAAHGVFESYGNAGSLTCAAFLRKRTTVPVFTRFSTVVGSRGSADAVRDTRGFATKLYTDEGTFDLVANNIPVFFIQDGIKFPDIVHAAKPHPDREIPQAQSAHDTFWDFVSLHTEAQAHAIWQMSDRGIPRSYRMMEGFGIHTFRLVNAEGATSLVKFHWKPRLGVHSLTWEEAQMINGVDPDFHRRDLADAIESGAHPQWELGVQVFPDTAEQVFEGIDLLDPTKIVPEEIAPVKPIGRLTLNANPTNYFAETEQVAFHPGHLVPGIEVTDDPLLQARLFSYLDTQISRLGGPNFSQLPINRPHAPVNDLLRDGMHQTADHAGVAPYKPNTLDGGCPFHARSEDGALLDFPQAIPESLRLRQSPASFEDHFSQATLFYRSLSSVEREHVIQGYTFELGKCYEVVIRERQLQNLANIDAELCAGVAAGLGLPAPSATRQSADPTPSPALSQVGGRWPVDGRLVGIAVDEGTDAAEAAAAARAVTEAGMVPLIIAPTGAPLADGTEVQRTYLTGRSVEYDALVVLAVGRRPADTSPGLDAKSADPVGPGDVDPRLILLIAESFRHAKPLLGPVEALTAAGAVPAAAGVLTDTSGMDELIALLRSHRVWDRFPAAV